MKGSENIGMNGLAQSLKKIFSKKKKKSNEDNFIGKTYEGSDDHFLGETNKNLIAALGLDKQSESYEKDLKRYGTRIGLMDVADDAIPNRRNREILPLKEPAKVRCFEEKYERDLERFGTRERIINVSNDDCRKKKKPVPFPTDFSKAVYKSMMRKCKPGKASPFSVNPFSDIFRCFPKAQVTIQNKSTEEKEVVLWGANQNISFSTPAPADVQDHTIISQISIPAGTHPQGIAVNPANQLVYIANQLSGTITVLDSTNQIVKIIQLEPTFPGFTSPVALTVNSKSSSSKYGYVYVACSVSNTIAVIDMSLNVVATIPVGSRPVALAFNPVNLRVYVANLVSDDLSVINAETLIEVAGSPLPTGQDPMGVGINPVNGEIYIANSLGNSITVYSSAHVLITTIPAVGQYPVSVTYNPANGFMYAVATNSSNVFKINALTHTVSATIGVGNKPYNSFFDSANSFLYVQNREDNTLSVIKSDNSIVATLNLGEQNIGGAFNSFNNSIYVSDTSNNRINVIGYLSVSSSLSINSDYSEMREDFQSNLAVIQHAKFVVTGLERLNSFRINKFTPTGRTDSRPISFELYASPQSKLNVAEVTELAGTVIDGKTNWRFKLPGLHTVSILVWYRQFEVREILNPTNHKSLIKNQ